jgi:hypothetical protein
MKKLKVAVNGFGQKDSLGTEPSLPVYPAKVMRSK